MFAFSHLIIIVMDILAKGFQDKGLTSTRCLMGCGMVTSRFFTVDEILMMECFCLVGVFRAASWASRTKCSASSTNCLIESCETLPWTERNGENVK